MELACQGSAECCFTNGAKLYIPGMESSTSASFSNAGGSGICVGSQEFSDEVEILKGPEAPPIMRILPGVVAGNLQKLINWSRKSSLWYLLFGIACCAIEGLMAGGASRYDMDRFGIIFRSSPRQADFMFVAGTINEKLAQRVKRLYDQMADPKWVIAMGSCAISGGPYQGAYNIVDGVDKIIPVDVYVPGCPPRPEALYYGIMKLQEKIRREGVGDFKKLGAALRA